MARVSRKGAGAGAGLHVPGIHRGLLESACAHYERRGGRGEAVVVDGREVGRKIPAHVDEHGQVEGFFFHSRRALDGIGAAVEAGETVVVKCGFVERAMWELDRSQPWMSVRLPFGRGVKEVRVSPDDRVVPDVREED